MTNNNFDNFFSGFVTFTNQVQQYLLDNNPVDCYDGLIDYISQVENRLKKNDEIYQGSALKKTVDNLASETKMEGLDLCGWPFWLWLRSTDDEVKTSAIKIAALGFCAWQIADEIKKKLDK